jgi:hypothetical protein
MTNLVAESGKLFGARHYRDYHFLLTLSDHVAHFGLEHHESNDSRLPERSCSPDAGYLVGGLLRMSLCTRGTGSFAGPRTSRFPTTSSRWRPICCGATRG